MDALVAVVIVSTLVCGMVAAVIAAPKNRSTLGYSPLGLPLGVIAKVGPTAGSAEIAPEQELIDAWARNTTGSTAQ